MIVENGVLKSLSVSQAEKFDPSQKGGCPTRWFFEAVKGLYQEYSASKEDGIAGHALLATYLSTGQEPKGRVKMGKAVTGVILKGELPKPGPDILTERRFSGQPQRDTEGKWIPVDPSLTFWLGGVPWDGSIDVEFRRGDVPEIWDHKFSADIRQYAKKPGELIRTIQMPIYVLTAMKRHSDAKHFRIVHNNVSRRGVDSFLTSEIVSTEQVHARKFEVEGVVKEMQQVAKLENPRDVPFNRKSCDAWMGCPHQSICPHFKEKRVSMTAEELALFDGLDDVAAPAREPGSDDDDPTPVQLPQQAPAPEPVAPVAAQGKSEPAAVLPPDAPPNDANEPPPAKAKKKAKPVIEDESTTPDEQLRLEAVKTLAAPKTAVNDGPGWQTVRCTLCGKDLGKRPQGHVIDPSLCPNAENHLEPHQPVPPKYSKEEIRRLVETNGGSEPARSNVVTLRIELDPETRELLRSLLVR